MNATATRFDRHSRKIVFVFWLLVIFVGLLITEWVLTPANGRNGTFGSSSGPGYRRFLVMREWKPNTDYHFAPPPERARYSNGGVRDVYDLATDAQGLIEPALRHPNPDMSIVFMGGSTTECLYVSPENRFPFLAARKLEDALGLKVNGINAARSGNNSVHSLLLLLGKVIPLKPDYVVLMEATNDIGTLSANGTYWAAGDPLHIVENQKISLDAAGRLFVNSLIPYTSQVVRQIWEQARDAFRGGAAKAEEAADSAHANGSLGQREKMGRDFASSLRSFVQVARAWGIEPILMTQVNVQAKTDAERQAAFLARERLAGAEVNPEEFATVHEYFNSIIRSIARSENVFLIDLANARDWNYGDVYDSIHFTDLGSQEVADIIAAKFRDEIYPKQRK